MVQSYLAAREKLLNKVGLTVLGLTDKGGTLTPDAAWKSVISGNVRPVATVDFSADDYLEKVDRQWLRLALEIQVLSSDCTFLISTPGEGAVGAPWAIVRLETGSTLAQHLTSNAGEPEFVTAARNGQALCGVTSEEDDIWLITVMHRRQ